MLLFFFHRLIFCNYIVYKRRNSDQKPKFLKAQISLKFWWQRQMLMKKVVLVQQSAWVSWLLGPVGSGENAALSLDGNSEKPGRFEDLFGIMIYDDMLFILVCFGDFRCIFTYVLFQYIMYMKIAPEARTWKHESWMPRLPWEHYVPVRMDLADMSHQMRWLDEHPEEAEKMGEQAARWTREFLSCLACLKWRISVFLDFANRFLLLQMCVDVSYFAPKLPSDCGIRASMPRQVMIGSSTSWIVLCAGMQSFTLILQVCWMWSMLFALGSQQARLDTVAREPCNTPALKCMAPFSALRHLWGMWKKDTLEVNGHVDGSTPKSFTWLAPSFNPFQLRNLEFINFINLNCALSEPSPPAKR